MSTRPQTFRTFILTFWSVFIYLAAVVLPNVLIEHFGIVDVVPGPWVLMAPAAVFAVGFALVARDILDEVTGSVMIVLSLIVIGSVISANIGSGRVAAASGIAFLLSEVLDLGIYRSLRAAGWMRAALISSLIGAGLDSLVFLWAAFGSLDFLAGQWVGKSLAIVVVVLLVGPLRRFWSTRDEYGEPVVNEGVTAAGGLGHEKGCDSYRLVKGERVYMDHDGPCRCRCGKPIASDNAKCEWHRARASMLG
jgi:uncharacterized PurR-regulated membrane protein YhhQ (DUF165 family)